MSSFWESQPVLKTNDFIVDNNQGIIKHLDKNHVITCLPDHLEWTVLDTKCEKDLYSIYNLLKFNYVSNKNDTARLHYSMPFLKWALEPPGYRMEWTIGIRLCVNKKLVGFISAIPVTLRIRGVSFKTSQVNFLCVHQKLRSQSFAPALIKEITRRVLLEGIDTSVYTSGTTFQTSLSICNYYYKNLDANTTTNLDDLTLRPIIKSDVPTVTKLLNDYNSQFDFTPIYSEDEVKHWFLPRDNVIYSYTTESVDQFVSFFQLPSTFKESEIKSMYLFYYYTPPNALSLTSLVGAALKLSRDVGANLFTCLDLMNNNKFLNKLNFKQGTVKLHYYAYNYKCNQVSTQKMALVML